MDIFLLNIFVLCTEFVYSIFYLSEKVEKEKDAQSHLKFPACLRIHGSHQGRRGPGCWFWHTMHPRPLSPLCLCPCASRSLVRSKADGSLLSSLPLIPVAAAFICLSE